MVGVVVRDERAGERHVVGGEHVEQLADRVGGVDDDGLAGLAVADEVHEVDHLAGDRIACAAKSRPDSSWRK